MARRKTRRGLGKAEQMKSGRWRARYTWPPATKPYAHRAPHTFHARSHAEAWLDAEQRLIALDAWTPPAERDAAEQATSLTVTELVDAWLDGADLKESTRQTHRAKLDARVLAPSRPGFDSLAGARVSEVDRRRVLQWWQQVRATWPTTAPTNVAAYRRLRTAFQYAADHLQVIEANPVQVRGVVAPRPESRDRPVLEVDEAHDLVNHAPARLRVPVLLLVWAGLRIGELLELRRHDLEGLDGKGPVTLKIRRNAQRVKDPTTGRQAMAVQTPKTQAGIRSIMLPDTVTAELRTHAAEHMDAADDALVVTTQAGRQMMDTNFRSRFNTAAERAGRPDITPHDCRRFFGTMLVNRGGISLEEARRIMGHETVEQLLEYQRASKGYERRAARGLEAVLTQAGSGDA